jgi:hypothetical protein
MKRQLLSPVLMIFLALLTAGVSRGSEWLLTLQQAETPPECIAANAKCGEIDDGHGGKVNCGTCMPPDTCGGSGISNICGCTPQTCAGHCGEFDPGCGRAKLSCGGCPGIDTCGGGGVPNVCGCTPKTCAGRNCDSIDPGCGLPRLSCGQCSGTDTCGGGGIPGVCGCTPGRCGGQNCGTINPGCGLPPLSCGQCTSPAFCFENSFCCTPQTCGDSCGDIGDGCGRTLHCRQCGFKTFCDDDHRCHPIGGGFKTEAPRKDPALCKDKGKNCGVIDDGQGGQVDCGTCKGKNTCGGGGVPNVCGRPDKEWRTP